MQIDTHFQFPKYSSQMSGETVDSWIHSLSTYFKTCPEMDEDMKIHIRILQLEGIVQAWWDTHPESCLLVIEIGEPIATMPTHIIS